MYYIFDPIQFREYGGTFEDHDDYYFRYQLQKKLFFNNMYIPYGPVCLADGSYFKFIDYIDTKRFTKISIDLPLIYDIPTMTEFSNELLKRGYVHDKPIFQDSETIILNKDDYVLDKEARYEIRYAQKDTATEVKSRITKEELTKIYNLYCEVAKTKGYVPKSIAVFEKLRESCLISVAYDKPQRKLLGFTLGYVSERYSRGNTFCPKDSLSVMQTLYTGTTSEGRKHHVGHSIYASLFEYAFNNGIDVIDHYGASRNRPDSYITFKKSFGGNFVSLPGSYVKTRLY